MKHVRNDGLKISVDITGDLPVPVISGSSVSVGAVVHACHEGSIDGALDQFSLTGLDRTSLDDVLRYCAERRCEADKASCPGCRRRTESQGLTSFDAFARDHAAIIIGDGSLRLEGPGVRTAQSESLETLAETWSGEKYWYWARRVIRKLRHGIRRAHIQGTPFAEEGQTPAVILMEPQLADNIGMVARAMANFGLDELRLVAPRDGWPNEKARIAASGANYVIDDAVAFEKLSDATADLTWVCATTARQRDLRKPILTPDQAVTEMSRRISEGQRCGMLFGRERNGLETAELADADALIMIPVNAEFASLNLAQAVLILGYTWMQGREEQSLGRVTTYEKPLQTGLNMGADRPATKQEQLGFFEHLESELDRHGFFNPVERRPMVVRNLRTLFTRMEPTAQEIRTLRGVVATLVRGKGPARKS
ncbi:RNA methyltransferase [Filomicrobium sp.]|uniref:RNA methyltransferase n=1 Tax=Filomicrobium sp. TaxID=2024831 RepID=UPI0025830044|nr:RNA methyltransferase [Filomicrobium sp.]